MIQVRCPVCADEFPWSPTPTIYLYNEENAAYEPEDISRMPPIRQAQMRVTGYRKCPHPSRDMAEHFLPATYFDYRDPLVVGLIGASSAGKTHLLTAMIREAHRDGLRPYGVQISALDFRRHDAFQNLYVKPLEAGAALPGTRHGVTEAADILLVRGPDGQTRPISFFDVAGEDLESTQALNPATRFLAAANAVIFVHGLEDTPDPDGAASRDTSWSFELAIERLKGVEGADRIPAAVAVTKADRLRYVPPVDRWLRHRDEHGLDAARLRAESRDVYAFLHHSKAYGSLRPWSAFRRCTLHFVSASGGDAIRTGTTTPARFVRGIHPLNVLQPLVAILAMSDMILGPEAGRVGSR